MQESFWRTEVWHPLTVHFPIALLLAATFSLFVSFFLGKARASSWQNASAGLLLAGCAGAWLAIYTGDMADGIVSRQICDPTVLKDHENASYTMALLFTTAAGLNLVAFSRFVANSLKKWIPYLICLLLFIGSGFLVYTGHLGATLVYQQGAGVNKPSGDCADFR